MGISADLKITLGIIASIISIGAYIPYIYFILKGKTKPHSFSWLVWGVLVSIGFAIQVTEGAGPGAWAGGAGALGCLAVFLLSFKHGEKNIKWHDWASLFGAFVALVLWFFTGDPIASIVLVVAIDGLGLIPTIRKTYVKPYEESMIMFGLGTLKNVLAFFALSTYFLTTWLYPVFLVVVNSLFMIMTFVRRRVVSNT